MTIFHERPFPSRYPLKPEIEYSYKSNTRATMPSQSDSLSFTPEVLTATPQLTDVYH